MSENIKTRDFSIADYDAALELWQRVEALEIAERDNRESVAQSLARNSRFSNAGKSFIFANSCKVYESFAKGEKLSRSRVRRLHVKFLDVLVEKR